VFDPPKHVAYHMDYIFYQHKTAVTYSTQQIAHAMKDFGYHYGISVDFSGEKINYSQACFCR